MNNDKTRQLQSSHCHKKPETQLSVRFNQSRMQTCFYFSTNVDLFAMYLWHRTEMTSKECNSGDPLETPGGLYRGPPSNENTIFKKMCMPNIKFKSVQCSFTMNVNQLQ